MPARKPRKWQRQYNSHLATDYPRKSQCGQCGEVVLVGLADGLDTKYDPYLLSQLGEIEALLRGKRTYWARHPMFSRRTTSTIRREPVPIDGFIIREHDCGTPRPTPQLLTTPRTLTADLPEECPF